MATDDKKEGGARKDGGGKKEKSGGSKKRAATQVNPYLAPQQTQPQTPVSPIEEQR